MITGSPTGIHARLRRVAVDAQAAATAARTSGMPYADEWVAILGRRVSRSNERARSLV